MNALNIQKLWETEQDYLSFKKTVEDELFGRVRFIQDEIIRSDLEYVGEWVHHNMYSLRFLTPGVLIVDIKNNTTGETLHSFLATSLLTDVSATKVVQDYVVSQVWLRHSMVSAKASTSDISDTDPRMMLIHHIRDNVALPTGVRYFKMDTINGASKYDVDWNCKVVAQPYDWKDTNSTVEQFMVEFVADRMQTAIRDGFFRFKLWIYELPTPEYPNIIKFAWCTK